MALKVRWSGEPASSNCMRDLHWLCSGRMSANYARNGPRVPCECKCHTQREAPGAGNGPGASVGVTEDGPSLRV